jgi:predicted  nucleic acid-binding Zn-ribbon protein
VENFTNKRDSLTLDVGLLTHEKEQLLKANQDISEINASLQKGIDEMNANASQLGFEQAEKVNALKLEHATLVEEIETLKTKREILSKDLDEKNNTLVTLGVLIKSIKVATEDTTSQIKSMTNTLNIYTGRVESASLTIQHESEVVKSLTHELSTVIDAERKANYEKSREIDSREIAVIGREKLAEMKYNQVIKDLNKTQ